MGGAGKLLIFLGLVLIVLGLLVSLAGRVPWIGRLPGDVMIRRDGFTLYFPFTTCLVVSAAISLVLYLLRR